MSVNTHRIGCLKTLWTILLFGFLNPFIYGQLTIKITDWPSQPNTPDIYLAGNFNGWNPGLAAYQLKKDAQGLYTITFQPSLTALEFKFTRGSWATVETNASGQDIANRKYTYTGGSATLQLSIAGWAGNQVSTASSNVVLLDDDFPIKSLQRKRRIWLYLPPDYHSQPNKSYPVIYLLDGQNVFDKATSFAGEWKVDETLNQLFQQGDKGCIVVAIANGEANRINEYSPWVHPQYGGGEGAQFLMFLTDELKPYIDQQYRTLPAARHTAIMGSSMGGLFSFYAGFQRPDVFGRVAPMSTSFWFAPEVFNWIKEKVPTSGDSKVYLTVGANEGGTQLTDMQKMLNLLLTEGFSASAIKADTDANEGHNEGYWSKKFPVVYNWLMKEDVVSVSETPDQIKPLIHCVDSTCVFEGRDCDDCEIAIYDYAGKLIVRKKMDSHQSWTMPQVSTAVFQVFRNQQLIHTEKFISVR